VTDEEKAGGPVIWSNPNQQVVREDQSGPGIEDPGHSGEGGPGETQAETQPAEGGPDLDAMTKDELLAYGQQLGISPMNANMTKEEIRTAIDQHRG
jgi:hypothetical protein